VISGIEKNWEIKDLVEIGIRALYTSIGYTKDLFQNSHGSIILDVIYRCLKYEEEDVRVIAMQCIVEIVRFCYDYLPEYMEGITDATFEQCK
jgi:glycopeptide antibiotics resistance protein